PECVRFTQLLELGDSLVEIFLGFFGVDARLNFAALNFEFSSRQRIFGGFNVGVVGSLVGGLRGLQLIDLLGKIVIFGLAIEGVASLRLAIEFGEQIAFLDV